MNNRLPLISVYITNHNYGKYLKQSVESVLNQSFKDFELIIIDDGSNDSSKKILKNYEKNPLIKVIYQKNKGLTISNNIAIKLAQGEYIVRLDADDYFHKDALKNLLTGFNDSEIGMVFGDWYDIDENGDLIERKKRHNFQKEVTLYDQPAHGACTMFRKKCLIKIDGYDESITRQDGYELWLRFIRNFKVNNINIPIFYYRQHFQSLTKDEKKLLNVRAEILENHANKYSLKKKKKFFAIVPIRGSEIDSRSKPFLKLNGKNLIDYTIDELIKSENLSLIIITTPSVEVIKYVSKKYKNNKIKIVKRSKESSRINFSLNQTVNDCIKIIKDIELYDSFFITSIETPFKRSELIDSAINTKIIFNVDSVIGLRSFDRTIYNHNGNGMVPLNKQKSKLKLERKQNYVAIPGFSLRDLNDYKKTNSLSGKKIGHVIFDQEASLFLNSKLDLVFAEAILRKNDSK